MDHFIDTKIPKLGIFVDKNSQNDQTPFPKVGRKTPGVFDCAFRKKNNNENISINFCRKCPEIKHAQYKYTMCYRTFVLVLFIVLYLQNRAFSN